VITTELISQQEDKRKLPDGWQWVRLGDVCEVKGGKRLPAGADFATEVTPFPYIRVIDFESGTVRLDSLRYLDKEIHLQISRYIINRDDVYISIAGSIGIVGVIPDELDGANLTENAARIVIKERSVLFRDFLAKYLQSPLGQESIKHRTNIVGQPKLALERIATIEIPLPPLDEQKRIAAILDEQMEAVERSRQATLAQLEAAKALPAAYLRAVFNSPEAQKWERKPLREVCRDISDGTHFTPIYVEQGVPFLSVKDVRETGISFDSCRFITEEQHKELCRRCKPERGDVLYTKVGTTGIAKAIDIDREFSIFVSVALLKLGVEIIPEYLEKVLNAPIGKAQAANLTQGMANRNLVIQDIKRIEIPVPTLPEQKRIAAIITEQLAEVERLKQSLESQLYAINKLPASLLCRAFNGEL
jgi:type I restriction enzyme S subunit